jgi:hypothetical protein
MDEIPLIIKEMCDDLSQRLRLQNKLTSVVSLMIGYSKEGGFSRQASLINPTNESAILYETLMTIFNKHIKNLPIRRVNLNFGKLTPLPDYEQLSLFENEDEVQERRALQYAIDMIQHCFGKNKILRASSLLDNSTIIERHNQIGGHRR